MQRESDAIFGFYQKCFNTVSTFLFFITFSAERKQIIFLNLISTDTLYLILF